MTRPPRVQYPDAIYHVYFRGNDGQDIFYDDEDREYFIDRLRQTVNRYSWRLFAFCEMTNHVHQYQQTPDPNPFCDALILVFPLNTILDGGSMPPNAVK